jgi:hypothetical protein
VASSIQQIFSSNFQGAGDLQEFYSFGDWGREECICVSVCACVHPNRNPMPVGEMDPLSSKPRLSPWQISTG